MAYAHRLALRWKRTCKYKVIAINCSPRSQDTQGVSFNLSAFGKKQTHWHSSHPRSLSGESINSAVVIQVHCKIAAAVQCSRSYTTLGTKQSPWYLSLSWEQHCEENFMFVKCLERYGTNVLKICKTFTWSHHLQTPRLITMAFYITNSKSNIILSCKEHKTKFSTATSFLISHLEIQPFQKDNYFGG